VSASDTVRHNAMTSNVMFLPHEPRALGLARRQIRAELTSLGLASLLLDDVALVVSELVGNAVQHARALPGGGLELAWWLSTGGVHLRVTDGGSASLLEWRRTQAAPGRDDHAADVPLGDSGRGLMIVDQLAGDWGVDVESPTRHAVWALIAVPPVAPVLRAVR